MVPFSSLEGAAMTEQPDKVCSSLNSFSQAGRLDFFFFFSGEGGLQKVIFKFFFPRTASKPKRRNGESSPKADMAKYNSLLSSTLSTQAVSRITAPNVFP